jgi:hypothetical protein
MGPAMALLRVHQAKSDRDPHLDIAHRTTARLNQQSMDSIKVNSSHLLLKCREMLAMGLAGQVASIKARWSGSNNLVSTE